MGLTDSFGNLGNDRESVGGSTSPVAHKSDLVANPPPGPLLSESRPPNEKKPAISLVINDVYLQLGGLQVVPSVSRFCYLGFNRMGKCILYVCVLRKILLTMCFLKMTNTSGLDCGENQQGTTSLNSIHKCKNAVVELLRCQKKQKKIHT